MKLPTPKTLWISASALVPTGIGIWAATLPKDTKIDRPITVALTTGIPYAMLLAAALTSGCNSISAEELNGLENTIKHSVSNDGSFKFEATKVSSGKIGDKLFQLVQVRFTATTPYPRQCSYVLYHHNTEAGLLTNQIIGMGDAMNGGCSITNHCFGCYGGSFVDEVKKSGYTGKIEDL